MNVDIAVLADAANLSREGKLNILGAFDQIGTKEFPVMWPNCVLVVRVRAHRSEKGDHKIQIRMANEDGEELVRIDGGFALGGSPQAGRPLQGDLIFPIPGLQIPEAGTYSFDILIDGRFEVGVPLYVSKVKP